MIAFFAGAVASHLFLNIGPGPFERTIWTGLHEGHRVIVSIGTEAFIFELNGKKLKISRATADFTEDENDPMVADTISSGGTSEPANPGANVL